MLCDVKAWKAEAGDTFAWGEEIPETGWAWACANHGADDETASNYGLWSQSAAEKDADHHVVETATADLIEAGELP